MSRGEILLPLICLIALGGGAILFSRDTPQQKPVAIAAVSPATLPDRSAPHEETPRHITPSETTVPETAISRADTIPAPSLPVDAISSSPTSWEDPFKPELWQSTGWTFTPQSMRSSGTAPASATFHRPYEKLMFECDIQAPETPGSKWELQLATRDAQGVMRLAITDGKLQVVTTENEQAHVILEKPLTTPLSASTPCQVRVVATGHRIVISWDRKRFLTTEQLASQSGREILWSINTTGAAYEISNLRIEGE